MEWQKLDKELLERLKHTDNHIVVYDPKTCEYPYDIINYLDLEECGISAEDKKYHWASLVNMENKYSYDDADVLNLFTHFFILGKPGKSKQAQLRMLNHELSCGCRYVPRDEFGLSNTCMDPIHRDFQL